MPLNYAVCLCLDVARRESEPTDDENDADEGGAEDRPVPRLDVAQGFARRLHEQDDGLKKLKKAPYKKGPAEQEAPPGSRALSKTLS